MPPHSTQLIATITGPSPDSIRAQSKTALDEGADLVELRLDALEAPKGPDVQALASEFAQRCICTLRPTNQGGHFQGSEPERLDLLRSAAKGRPRLIDLEFQTVLKSAADSPNLPTGTDGLIVSVHDFSGRPPDLARTIRDLAHGPQCTVPKIAWAATNPADNFTAFDLLRGAPKPAIVICMGHAGLLSRVLAAKFGAFATYCCPRQNTEAAPGQPTLEQFKTGYRWDQINADTEVFGVIGWPVVHSLSPHVFNAAFEHTRMNAVYLPIPLRPGPDGLQSFTASILDRPWTDFRGLSVTLPHKEPARQLCRDALDEHAARCGAANTLTVRDGALAGSNTDAPAVVAVLTRSRRCRPDDLRGVPVDVLGAGGVARAVVAALANLGCQLTIYNRTPQRARDLAAEFACQTQPWTKRTQRTGEIVINCTPLGMSPHVDQSPLPDSALQDGLTVLDTVYNPIETRLLAEARSRGCRTISGLHFFLHQAAAQFQAWTGKPAPVSVMENAARDELQRIAHQPDIQP